MRLPRLELPSVSSPLPVYMVGSGSYGLSVPSRRRLSWIDSRALGGGGPRIVALTMGDSKPGANIFPPFPGERPTSEDILKWLKEATPLLTADESALAGGLVPRSLLTYSPSGIVPVPLIVATGITETAVAAREALILDREDANQSKLSRRSGEE